MALSMVFLSKHFKNRMNLETFYRTKSWSGDLLQFLGAQEGTPLITGLLCTLAI